jgi:spore coat polysaccharide biosynthesis protein SpsF (cytidylyltransferase family)
VTPYIYNHPNVFKIANVPYAKDVSHIRLTLDEPQDYEQMKIVAAALFGKGHYVHLEEILDYLGKHPKLLELNRSIGRNEGYLKSLALD